MSIKKNIFAPWASGLGATRRAAMLLVMMLTTATAWAQTTITPTTPSQDGDGNYLIGNAAELYGFADLVNNGNKTANAKLTANIVVNENVLDANGEANTGDFVQWTPIGNVFYSGTFDGQGHTISGLYVSGNSYSVGLIGTVSGSATIKNLGIVDSYFNSSGNFLGSIVGDVDRQSSVTLANVYSTSTVKGVNYIGGLVNGSGKGSVTIINSYFAGKTSADWSYGTHHDDLVAGEFDLPTSGTLIVVNTFVVGTSLYGTQVTTSQLTDGTVAAALHYYQDALADGSMFGLSGGKTNFSGTIDGVSIPTANITLHTFTGDTKTYSSKYVVGNTTPLPVNVACVGYNKFAGWYNNANLVGNAVTSISSSETGDKEYWAKYKQSHTVTFELNGGLIEGGEIDHYIEGEVTPLPALVFNGGASFEGWYTTADFSGDRYVAIPATATEDMTFYAKWGEAKTSFYLMQPMQGPEPVNVLYEGENIVWLDETTQRYEISNNEHKYWGSGNTITVPYVGGEYAFSDNGGSNFRVHQSGFYVFTLTDKGGGIWSVSVLKLKSMLNCDVASIPTQVYTGSAIEPDVTVKDGETPLDDEDYEVTYSNNVNAGTATVTITGKGDYSGETAATFTIIPKAVTNDGITIAAIADQTYTGSAIEPAVTVKDGETTLALGTDYTIGYSANVYVGTATATITGKGNYSGEKAATFTISPKAVTNEDITVTIPSQTWTGNELTPVITVKDGENVLTENTDYTVTAPSRPVEDSGNYTYTITGMGNYAGSKEATFTILPPTVVVNVTGNGTVTYNDKVATNGEVIGVTADKGTDVTLTLAPESGYAVSIEYGYKSNGMTVNGAKLPINGSAATLTVPNDMKDGTYVNLTVTFVSALAGGADEASAVALTDNTLTNFAGGWYKVDSDIIFDHTLNLLGDTHLIIDDGKTMTVNTATDRGIDSDYTLTVSGAGALSVTTIADYGIAVCVGNYVQTGATVTASGYIGIRCTDGFIAFNFDNDFTFSGGQLTATGNSRGIRADNNITLSCTNATDFIQASSYRSVDGAVKIAEGNALTDGTEASNGMNGYSGTLTNEQITAIGGKTLHRAVTTSYVDASGTLHENVIAIPLDNTMTTLAAGWYVVNSDVDYTGTVTLSGNVKLTLSGDVKLILSDDCTMSFGKDGELLNATIMECNNHNLTIYGQSGGTGWLKAYSAQYDGIKNVNYYTQNSGNVLISDGNGACIKAGEFTILGGTLDLKDVGGANGEIVTTENINIRGGKLWARYTGLKTNGKIILDYTNATDQIRAYSYQFQNGLEIADGKTLVDANGTIWSGTFEVVSQIGFKNSTLKPVMGVTLTKDGNNVSATFNGTSTTTMSIPVDVNVTSVTYNRTFTEGKPSTVMLPFNKAVSEIGGGTFYTFGGVEKKNNKWEATMNEVTGSLTANTPYLFVPTGTSLTFTGGATLNTTGGGNCLASDAEGWEFHGTYSKKIWNEVETHDYGFAATSGTSADDKSVEAGQFVRLTTGASAKPMRCYLSYVGSNTPNAGSNDNLVLTLPKHFKILSVDGQPYTGNGQDLSKGSTIVIEIEAGYKATNVEATEEPIVEPEPIDVPLWGDEID